MPYVTTTVRDWGIGEFPDSAALQMVFSPSAAGVSSTRVYPQADVVVDVPSDGTINVNLVDMSNLLNDVYFKVRFQWFEGGALRWSELPGKLRSTQSGDLKDLLEIPDITGILYGFGPPPSWLDGVIYIDTSGDFPDLYMPKGALI